MDKTQKPREFMHAHPDGDLERSDGVKCFHVIEKRVYLEAVEKYSALSLKHSDLVDKFVIQKQELNHKTEIVCGEENKTITVAWAYVERRVYDELKLENERLKEENFQFRARLLAYVEVTANKDQLLTHLEQALESVQRRTTVPYHEVEQALEKVKEFKK